VKIKLAWSKQEMNRVAKIASYVSSNCWGWSMPRTQTLDHTHTHAKRGSPKFMRCDKMPTFPQQKREIY